MKTIPVGHGQVALVDDEDFERLSGVRWKTDPYGYASRTWRRNGKNYYESMHRVILAPPAGMEADHINGDRLDNRRSNLRVATREQQMRNTAAVRGKLHSEYKGVTRSRGRWMMRLKAGGKSMAYGLFRSEVAAAMAYDTAARRHFGAFARPNFPAGIVMWSLALLLLASPAFAQRDPAKCGRIILARAETLAAMGGGIFRMPKNCDRVALVPGLTALEREGRMVLSANGIEIVLSRRSYEGVIPADSQYEARMLLREEKR